jgi:hypothetical protein
MRVLRRGDAGGTTAATTGAPDGTPLLSKCFSITFRSALFAWRLFRLKAARGTVTAEVIRRDWRASMQRIRFLLDCRIHYKSAQNPIEILRGHHKHQAEVQQAGTLSMQY